MDSNRLSEYDTPCFDSQITALVLTWRSRTLLAKHFCIWSTSPGPNSLGTMSTNELGCFLGRGARPMRQDSELGVLSFLWASDAILGEKVERDSVWFAVSENFDYRKTLPPGNFIIFCVRMLAIRQARIGSIRSVGGLVEDGFQTNACGLWFSPMLKLIVRLVHLRFRWVFSDQTLSVRLCLGWERARRFWLANMKLSKFLLVVT